MRHTAAATGVVIALLPLASCANGGSAADAFPARPIELTVGWSAGGSSDLTTRGLATGMEEDLGVSVQIVNVEGATGGVGASQVSHQPADGYSIFGGASTAGMWRVMEQSDASWEDFYALLAGPSPTTIFVRADSEYGSIEDLVEGMEDDPSMRYGTPGPGSNGHILGELLKQETGTEAEHVPYNGGSEAGRFLVSGEIDFVSVTLGDILNLVESGDVRPLANLYEEPVEVAGVEIPPIVDTYPALADQTAINPWFGVYVSRDTPPEIVERLAESVRYATEQDGFRELYEGDLGGIVDYTVGHESDEVMARVEASRSWALHGLGMTEHDPAEFDIPTISEFEWPPHGRAANAAEWPEGLR
ncbi:tripartite-type tricarboxylate transporter receptor subunit TctC [Spinactinospora alkalitolerans]|uniref:Tripartite-type tricarboxylate transporter receptor subunit TctC n=1 Tax=Spinactinospora alkalitolerans TaxID=687207 RepID=A0A852TYW0_9ACTN|nr:tripartite tricarboxylate transporter substrate binding protein [Spinactinospora alkalitolerans]NYE48487.1 tripartite-type tricarboxylate transporter receptor subunit TctC [Spinactinospora alkalitolerans]